MSVIVSNLLESCHVVLRGADTCCRHGQNRRLNKVRCQLLTMASNVEANDATNGGGELVALDSIHDGGDCSQCWT